LYAAMLRVVYPCIWSVVATPCLHTRRVYRVEGGCSLSSHTQWEAGRGLETHSQCCRCL